MLIAEIGDQWRLGMLSRDELYRLVWSKPMTKVADQFEVSSSYLARICTYLNVPRPGRGYWAKLAVSKAPRKLPLPALQPGDPEHWSKGEAPLVVAKPDAPIPPTPRKRVRIAPDHVHGMVRGARSHFESGREVEEGAYLRPYKKLLVDVAASKAGLEKALALANDLFNAFESIGHRVTLAPAGARLKRGDIDEREAGGKSREHWHRRLWSPDRPTVVYVGTLPVGLSIVEMSEHVTLRYVNGAYVRESEYVAPRSRYAVDRSWTTTRDIPSGRMRIVAYLPYDHAKWSTQWQETKSRSLDGHVRTIAKEVEAMAPSLVSKVAEADRQAEIRHQEWLAQMDRWHREEDRKHVEQSIADSRTELQRVIGRWSEVMSTERFLARVEKRASELPDHERDALLERLALARSFLGTQEPLDFFRCWKTPEERYKPRFSSAEDG